MMRGRVGDSPILGAGLYAGPHGAAAATGLGERILDAGLTREAHRWMSEGATPETAAQMAVAKLAARSSIGIVVIGQTSMAAGASRAMPWAGREAGSNRWIGPEPGERQGTR